MDKKYINTPNAPAAIGAYSQAVQVGNMIYVSGQIPLLPETGEMISKDFNEQAKQVFANLSAIAEVAGTDLNRAVKLTVYLTDLNDFPALNDIMADAMQEPFPARAAVQVAALPKGAQIEIDALLCAD